MIRVSIHRKKRWCRFWRKKAGTKLFDSRYCRQTENDIATQLQASIQTTITDTFSAGHFLLLYETQPLIIQKFYLVPKTHKETNPGHSIVFCPTEILA